jgi:hypothetical protein
MKGRIRASLSQWANSDEQRARDLETAPTVHECSRIGAAPDREKVRLSGDLQTVTLRPRGGVPVLEAELYDGSGVVTIVWLGRRRIAGINPGRSIEAEGRIGISEGRRVMYNPRYELLP